MAVTQPELMLPLTEFLSTMPNHKACGGSICRLHFFCRRHSTQRGVGTSTNGAGAFGATVNLKTQGLRTKAYATTNNTVGSFKTLKNNVEFGTGLLMDKFTLDGRLSRISSDGYIDRATSDLKSLYLSGGYYGDDEVLKLTLISGKEKTYQAWNGVPLDTSTTIAKNI